MDDSDIQGKLLIIHACVAAFDLHLFSCGYGPATQRQ